MWDWINVTASVGKRQTNDTLASTFDLDPNFKKIAHALTYFQCHHHWPTCKYSNHDSAVADYITDCYVGNIVIMENRPRMRS